MKKNVFLLTALLISATTFAQNWSLDKAHSKLGFGVTHLVISTVDGSFKSFDVKLTSSKEDFSDAVVELTAQINTVNTDNEKRDGHLQSPDFFDAAKFPTLTFKSKSFKKNSDKKYTLSGDLTLHGVTKPVELDVTVNGPVDHPFNKKKFAAFKVTGTIKRSDFTVGGGTPTGVVGDEVAISASLEMTKD